MTPFAASAATFPSSSYSLVADSTTTYNAPLSSLAVESTLVFGSGYHGSDINLKFTPVPPLEYVSDLVLAIFFASSPLANGSFIVGINASVNLGAH